MPRLVTPGLAHMASFVDAMKEGYSRDTLRAETPETIAEIAAHPAGFIETLRNPPPLVTLPDGAKSARMPATDLWYVEGDAFLGSINIRHSLSPLLAAWGGHVGYAVRPAARGQGHATAMLAGALDHIRRELSLARVQLTVNTKNLASVRVVEKNGGVAGDLIPHPWIEGDQGRHYWIDL